MLRVLIPGGWAILQIPIFKPLIEKTIEDHTLEDPKKRTELFLGGNLTQRLILILF